MSLALQTLQMATRITELPNELTANIDSVGAVGIARLLRQSDAQLFAGWGAHPSINDAAILTKISYLAGKAAKLLKENQHKEAKNVFVFSGCGTSGRIAWICSRAYNRLLCCLGNEPCFHYLISGGDVSLIISNELPEDDPPLGAQDLEAITKDAQQVMFFGVSCGLSAPYVAGQIDYAMHQPKFTTVLVGFNPVTLARDARIEKWHRTCKDVFLELEELSQKSERAVVLNPIVGPEPITGSSRMKGGSMTEILLDTIFTTALCQAFEIPLEQLIGKSSSPTPSIPSSSPASSSPSSSPSNSFFSTGTQDGCAGVGSGNGECCGDPEVPVFEHSLCDSHTTVASIIDAFTSVYQAAYRPVEGMASLLSLAADCLRHPDGHLYYIGANTFGILGLIDSSEMVDTYGSGPEEIRGFVLGGWGDCGNQEGDLSDKGPPFRISHTHFEEDHLSNLSPHDCVILLGSSLAGDDSSGHLGSIMERVLSSPAKCGLLVMADAQTTETRLAHLVDARYCGTVLVRLPYYSVLGKEPLFAGFALKLVLNAISTGANVMKGRVYGNTMINLTIANDKLFFRSVDIVSDLSGCGSEEARVSLLRAIYRQDNVDEYRLLPVSSHITAATQQSMVIPLAMVLSSGRCGTVAEAVQVISATRSLRTLIK